jgi:acetyltransferase
VTALDALFAPRRVAVLGASRNPAKLGHVLLDNVLRGGFAGEVFVVNPSGEPILGRPSLADVADLPCGVDLALVSVPPAAVLPVVTALAARGVRAAVILTSGFGEVDDRGRREQAALRETARAGGMRLVGPNCMGVFSAPVALNGTYFWELPRLPGGIAVVSQSGAYGGLIVRHLGGLGLGVARFLSIGNQADVSVADALEFLAGDPETRLVACFVESVPDGRRFVAAARRVTASKPMVVLKGGRTDAGRRAAGSHTGSLAGAAEVHAAAFRAAGVVQCGETEELLDAIQALASGTPRPSDASLAIVTVSGGPSVVAADVAEALGIAVPPTPDALRDELRPLVPAFAALGNPIDLTPQVEPRLIPEVVECIVAKMQVGGVIAITVGLDLAELASGLVDSTRAAGKPLVACAVDAPSVSATLAKAGVPVYPTPERAVRAFRALWTAGQGPEPVPAAVPPPVLRVELESILASAHGPMPYDLARELLAAYGVRFCHEVLVHSEAAAREAAWRMGFPGVLKTARPDVLHRTEAGGVVTDVVSLEGVSRAWATIAGHVGGGPVLVQEQVSRGSELLAGGRRDEGFGPVVVVGLGGFLAEAVGDVSLALAPVAIDTARAIAPAGLRRRLASGYRGLPGWEAEPVARAVVGIGRVLADHPRVREIDVNPLIVRGSEAVAVDALVVLD